MNLFFDHIIMGADSSISPQYRLAIQSGSSECSFTYEEKMEFLSLRREIYAEKDNPAKIESYLERYLNRTNNTTNIDWNKIGTSVSEIYEEYVKLKSILTGAENKKNKMFLLSSMKSLFAISKEQRSRLDLFYSGIRTAERVLTDCCQSAKHIWNYLKQDDPFLPSALMINKSVEFLDQLNFESLKNDRLARFIRSCFDLRPPEEKGNLQFKNYYVEILSRLDDTERCAFLVISRKLPQAEFYLQCREVEPLDTDGIPDEGGFETISRTNGQKHQDYQSKDRQMPEPTASREDYPELPHTTNPGTLQLATQHPFVAQRTSQGKESQAYTRSHAPIEVSMPRIIDGDSFAISEPISQIQSMDDLTADAKDAKPNQASGNNA